MSRHCNAALFLYVITLFGMIEAECLQMFPRSAG